NVLAVGDGLGLAPRVVTGFVDLEVNRLLGLDPSREVALELIALRPEAADAPGGAPPGAIDHATLPPSSSEGDYPLLPEMHAPSSLATAAAVGAWREGAWRETTTTAGATLVALPPPRERAGRGLGETIQRRGSTREFGHAPLTAEELATTLWVATRRFDGDAPSGLVDLYLIVNAVGGGAAGACFFRPDDHALRALATGALR